VPLASWAGYAIIAQIHHPSLSDDDFPKSAPDATVDGTESARPDSDSSVRRVRCLVDMERNVSTADLTITAHYPL